MAKRKRFRWGWGLVFLVLIVGAITMIVLIKNNVFNDKPKEDNSANVTEPSTDKKTEDIETEPAPEQKKEIPQYEGESPNKSETLTGLITYAGVSGEELMIRVSIDQFLQSGNCNLTITNNGSLRYTKSVAIQESVTTSICDGFNIPVSELPKGDLKIEILLESGDKSGKIVESIKI